MSRSVVIRQSQGYLSTLPLGAIVAWHRDLPGVDGPPPEPPPGWVLCEGQVLEDRESPLDGTKIPNLNKDKRFLRGGTKSGAFQGQAMQGHTHLEPKGQEHLHKVPAPLQVELAKGTVALNVLDTKKRADTTRGAVALGPPETADWGAVAVGRETRPINFTVVWIMKVKQITAAAANPVVAAAERAPEGAIYVSGTGGVGLGTTRPQARLDVKGGLRVDGKDVLAEIDKLIAQLKAQNLTKGGTVTGNLTVTGTVVVGGRKLVPVHRAWNPNNGDHFFTVSEHEAKSAAGYNYEGIGFYAYQP